MVKKPKGKNKIGEELKEEWDWRLFLQLPFEIFCYVLYFHPVRQVYMNDDPTILSRRNFERFAEALGVDIFYSSSKDGTNVDQIVQTVVEKTLDRLEEEDD